MTDDGFEHDHTIAVVDFMCEESSRFGAATLGSKAMRDGDIARFTSLSR